MKQHLRKNFNPGNWFRKNMKWLEEWLEEPMIVYSSTGYWLQSFKTRHVQNYYDVHRWEILMATVFGVERKVPSIFGVIKSFNGFVVTFGRLPTSEDRVYLRYRYPYWFRDGASILYTYCVPAFEGVIK